MSLTASQSYAIYLINAKIKKLDEDIAKLGPISIEKKLKQNKVTSLTLLIGYFSKSPTELYNSIIKKPDLLNKYPWASNLNNDPALFEHNQYFALVIDCFKAYEKVSAATMTLHVISSEIADLMDEWKTQGTPQHIQERDKAIKEINDKIATLSPKEKNTPRKTEGLNALIDLLKDGAHFDKSVFETIGIFYTDHKENYQKSIDQTLVGKAFKTSDTETLLMDLQNKYRAEATQSIIFSYSL